MTAPDVRAMRLSFIWLESQLSFLQEAESTAPFSFLGRDYTYEPKFENIRSMGKSSENLLLPWPKPAGQHFWTHYFDGAEPGLVKARDAWRALVPVRLNPPLSVAADWFRGKVTVEGFFFPHAIATLLTFDVRAPKIGQLTLDQCVEIAHDIRQNKKLRLIDPPAAESTMILDALKDRIREKLRHTALGDSQPFGNAAGRPFTVTTFLSINSEMRNAPLEDGGDEHRAFQALVEWSPTWRDDELAPLDTYLVRRRKASPKSDVVFAAPRGRVIWMPKFAIGTPPNRPKLSCYHRNQILAAMQIDALIGLIKATDAQIEQWQSLPRPQRECAQLAAGALTRLWIGKPTTYQSRSLQRQLADAEMFEPLTRVRAAAGLGAFSLP
jgi:hypothetical protein